MTLRTGASRVRLGVILPDDPIDSEMTRLDEWLRARGRADVEARTLLSKAIGGHVEEDLYKTGNLAVIAPRARELADAGCSVIVWACTSGSFIGGLDWARRQARGLEEAAGVAATSTTLAFIEAVHWLGHDVVDLLGAYPEAVTRALIRCLGSAGIAVDRWLALGTPDGPSSFRLDLRNELARFCRALEEDAHRPILIPDTAINSLELVAELEDLAARPVLTANQVSLWHGLRLAGTSPGIADAGSLLKAPADQRHHKPGRGGIGAHR